MNLPAIHSTKLQIDELIKDNNNKNAKHYMRNHRQVIQKMEVFFVEKKQNCSCHVSHAQPQTRNTKNASFFVEKNKTVELLVQCTILVSLSPEEKC